MKDDTKKRIAELLSSEEPDTRRRAAEDLCAQSGLAVIAALAAALNDENKGVRDAASRTLLTMGGANVARAIVEYIADDNIITRNLAGELLRQLGKESVPALLPYLQDTNHDVRKFSADLIGLIGWEEVARSIVPLLQDKDENVLIAAVEALGNLRNAEFVSQLILSYKEHQYAQASVAEALGKIGGSRAGEFLLLAFNKSITDTAPDPLLLCTLIDSLGAVGDEHALIMLQNRVQSVRAKLRHALLHAVIRIAERVHGKVDLPLSLTGDLLGMLKDDDPRIKASAAKGLASSSDGDVTRALLQCFAIDDELDEILYSLLEQRDDAMYYTVELLAKSESVAQKQKVKLVGQLANSMIQRILRRESCHIDDDLLARGFGLIEAVWPSADEETRAAIVDTLFRLDGDRTVGFLDTIMEDPDPWLRMNVIEHLAGIEDRRVPVFVNRFLKDDDEMVREVAMATLQSRPEMMNNSELIS